MSDPTNDPKEETLTELFSRDPFSYTKQDLDRLITYYRDARRTFAITGKPVKEKQVIDLKDLGIL
jgi:hypothetical protein